MDVIWRFDCDRFEKVLSISTRVSSMLGQIMRGAVACTVSDNTVSYTELSSCTQYGV